MASDFQLLTSARGEPPDLEERDYHMINSHLTVEYEDIIAEPETIHTFNCVRTCSFFCFNFCHTFWYTLSTLCCGLCAVMQISWELAATYFCVIWCGTPCRKATEFHLRCPQRLCADCAECAVVPCCEDIATHLQYSTNR